MTNIDIAREIGACECFGNDVPGCSQAFIFTEAALDAFAERIRADERERAALDAMERCAVICEELREVCT